MTNAQLILSSSIPSLLVVLSWIHNNTGLSRLEAASDTTNRRMDDMNRRMDDLVKGFHADMMGFQSSILSEFAAMRERLATLKSRAEQNGTD